MSISIVDYLQLEVPPSMKEAVEDILLHSPVPVTWDTSLIPWMRLRRLFFRGPMALSGGRQNPTAFEMQEFEELRAVYYNLSPARMAAIDHWWDDSSDPASTREPTVAELLRRIEDEAGSLQSEYLDGQVEVFWKVSHGVGGSFEFHAVVAPSQLPLQLPLYHDWDHARRQFSGASGTLSLTASGLLALTDSANGRTYSLGDTGGLTHRLGLVVPLYVRPRIQLAPSVSVAYRFPRDLNAHALSVHSMAGPLTTANAAAEVNVLSMWLDPALDAHPEGVVFTRLTAYHVQAEWLIMQSTDPQLAALATFQI